MTDLATWSFFRIALLVTGKGEEQFLPRLFRSLAAERHCSFIVGRRIPQLRPITSERRKQKIVGRGKSIPRLDQDIGISARRYLIEGFHYVIVVDDLERDSRDQAEAVFQRYRTALDTILGPAGLSPRASIHLLVNMLEAYYFAHAAAVNAVLGTELADFEGDVETIGHPKNDLKQIHPGFDEIKDGRAILEQLDVPRVLSNPETCQWLRTLFGWCSRAIGREFSDVYQLASGRYSEVTRSQIDALPEFDDRLKPIFLVVGLRGDRLPGPAIQRADRQPRDDDGRQDHDHIPVAGPCGQCRGFPPGGSGGKAGR